MQDEMRFKSSLEKRSEIKTEIDNKTNNRETTSHVILPCDPLSSELI